MSRTASAEPSTSRPAGGSSTARALNAEAPVAETPGPPSQERLGWTFMTNHLHVLLCIAQDPTIRLRDVAAKVGITERATQSIVADLVAAGYLTRLKVGRRNQYRVNADIPLRHPLECHHSVASLLEVLMLPPEERPARRGASRRTG